MNSLRAGPRRRGLLRKKGRNGRFRAPRLFETSPSSVQTVERPLEPAGVRFLGLGEGLEPVGDLVEAFVAGGARHARIHVGVFVRLAGNRRAQIVGGAADRLAGRRGADLPEVFEAA